METSFNAVVIFGDSMSDAGLHGFGNVAQEYSEMGGYPAGALKIPNERLKREYGSLYPFPAFGYKDHMCSNGCTWAKLLEELKPGLKTYNFAHAGASACQEVDEGDVIVIPPPGYQGVSAVTGMGYLRPRGVAQQLRQAEQMQKLGILPNELFKTALVVVFIGSNDLIFTWSSDKSAVGHTPDQVVDCGLVKNHQMIHRELQDILGVPSKNILFGGLPALELAKYMADLFPDDLDAIKRQIDLVNCHLEKIAPRWRVAEWMRAHMVERTPTIACHAYKALPLLKGREGLPSVTPVALGSEKWFDEVHPSAATFRSLAENFLNEFLAGRSKSEDGKTVLMAQGSPWHEVLETAKGAAQMAGEQIRLAWTQRSEVKDTKSNATDLVTETDQRCEDIIMGVLRSKFPTHQIIGEESSGSSKYELTDAPTWTIDPIDGTTNFVHRLALSCVIIAHLTEKQVRMGLVYDPLADEMFWATQGGGAFLKSPRLSKQIHVSNTTSVPRAVISMDPGYGRNEDAVDAFSTVQRAILLKGVRNIRVLGSTGLNMAYVASGRFDAGFEIGSWEKNIGPKIWDFSAGKLIVEEAGGVTRDVWAPKPTDNGLDLMGRSFFCAATKELAAELLDVISNERSSSKSPPAKRQRQ